MSAEALGNLGYKHVSYVEGGMESWKDIGLPKQL